MTNFERALLFVEAKEGGLADRPLRDDPGGLTKFGISQAAFPDEDIRHLTIHRARQLYKQHYWDLMRCDEMPFHVALVAFDASVMHGPDNHTRRMLQYALRASQDGVIGPKTLEAAHRATPSDAIRRFVRKRIVYMASLSNWGANKNGWTDRMLSLQIAAVTASLLDY